MDRDSSLKAEIPMQDVGPLYFCGPDLEGEITVPLATFETPLWPSVSRGARLSKHAGGISAVHVHAFMSRSICIEGPSAAVAAKLAAAIPDLHEDLQNCIAANSRFARLKDCHSRQLGKLLYIRLEILTGDASGHNMVTQAADDIMNWLLEKYPDFTYVSVSGNYCTDKKVSAVNGIRGRGHHVVTELVIPETICRKFLKSDPAILRDVHVKKNLLGSIMAGSLASANAHYANMLLAFYLATGQDAANIVEGSQGIVHVDVNDDGSLYFSCTLPNLIVGTVGNGKGLPFVQENLEKMGCTADLPAGENARRLALIAGGVVLCGELSLLAALSNQGELMVSHRKLERGKADNG